VQVMFARMSIMAGVMRQFKSIVNGDLFGRPLME
jgi:hypothetical protein